MAISSQAEALSILLTATSGHLISINSSKVEKWKSLSCVQLFSIPWNSPGQNTGVGSLFLLQGIFPTQGLNLGLLHCRQILYQMSHKWNPRMEPGSSALQVDSLPVELSGKPYFYFLTMSYFMSQDFIQDTMFYLIMISSCLFSLLQSVIASQTLPVFQDLDSFKAKYSAE